MKYGNFVGTKSIPMTDNEIKEITETLTEFINSIPSVRQLIVKDKKGNVSPEIEKYDDSSCITVHFDFKKPVKGRNGYMARIDASSIDFLVSKYEGYIKKKHIENGRYIFERDEEYNVPFSYRCTLFMVGDEIPYRHKQRRSIQNWSPYTYGTEIKDLVDYGDKDIRGRISRTVELYKRR